MIFDRTPPGYSLTQEPKGAPFEHPPEISDPVEAARYHLGRLSEPDLVEDALFFLEEGVPIAVLVQGILRGAVMQGMHSVDVSLIIAPILHEHIKQLADLSETPYEEGLDDPKAAAAIKYERNVSRARAQLNKLDIKPEKIIEGLDNESMIVGEDTPEPEEESEDPVMEMLEENMDEVKKEKPMGLMSREVA